LCTLKFMITLSLVYSSCTLSFFSSNLVVYYVNYKIMLVCAVEVRCQQILENARTRNLIGSSLDAKDYLHTKVQIQY
jgi:hypothetical protein